MSLQIPSHRVVEQQLFIPGFLPEFLETSGDQENFWKKLKLPTLGIEPGTAGWKSNVLTTTTQQLHDDHAQINIKNGIAKFFNHLRFPKFMAKLSLVLLL